MRCAWCLSGGIYIPPEALAPAERGDRLLRGQSLRPIVGLTERQMDVVALMMQGKSNKAISRILDVAEPTVKHHVTAILKALKVANRTEAVIAVGALGWELPQIGNIQRIGVNAAARIQVRPAIAALTTARRFIGETGLCRRVRTARAGLVEAFRSGVTRDQKRWDLIRPRPRATVRSHRNRCLHRGRW